MTASPACIGNHIYSSTFACKICVPNTGSPAHKLHLLNSRLNIRIKSMHHDIFMYEVSIGVNTWRGHVESGNEPSRGFMVTGFIRQGWDGGGEGEPVSFNRHLGFDGFWGATWGFVSFYSRKRQGAKFHPGPQLFFRLAGLPRYKCTTPGMMLSSCSVGQSGSLALGEVCMWKPKWIYCGFKEGKRKHLPPGSKTTTAFFFHVLKISS